MKEVMLNWEQVRQLVELLKPQVCIKCHKTYEIHGEEDHLFRDHPNEEDDWKERN